MAQARQIDAVLVTELSRWGRSTQDLLATLNDLHSWGVSVLAQNGLAFDLATSTGKLMCTIMAGIATFERDLIRERVKSGLAATKVKGKKLGRPVGTRPSERKAKRVLRASNERGAIDLTRANNAANSGGQGKSAYVLGLGSVGLAALGLAWVGPAPRLATVVAKNNNQQSSNTAGC